MESRTHLLDIPSELGALVQATIQFDPQVKEIHTLYAGKEPFQVNPLMVKVLGDHARRTGTPIQYRVVDAEGTHLYEGDPAREYRYAPTPTLLDKISNWKPTLNKIPVNHAQPIQEQLHAAALQGMRSHFSTSNGATEYGAAIQAGDVIYTGGVYGSFDHRLNVHAEMAAALSAMMDGNSNISRVALVSTKFTQEPCHMCGCCRQFFSEIQEKTKQTIEVFAFTLAGGAPLSISLKDYLPYAWHSGESTEKKD